MRVAIAAALAGAALAALAGIAAAVAGEPVALIMDVVGTTEPAVEPFSEFLDGDRVRLGANGEVTFAHYGSCENVVVHGGVLSLTASGYRLEGGRVVDVKPAPCPKDIKVTGAGEIGGVVMRGVPGGGLKLGDRPAFTLGGPARAAFTQLRIERDGTLLFQGPIVNQRFVWPFGYQPLGVASGYELHLLRSDGSAKVVPFEVIAEAPRSEPVVAVE